ncbi:MAG: helicase-associated domain-containing protein, partial [Thermoanaerobaculia bacterium]
PRLRSLVLQALGEHGGILTASRLPSAEAGALPLHRQEWRAALERLRLGTTGVISLRDFGIDLEEEGLLIFQELILQNALDRVRGEAPECDREVSLGVDLLVDLERILEIVHMEQVEVTREGTLFKKTEERIGPKLITPGCAEVFNGEAVQFLFGLCRRLNFFDLDGARLRCDQIRRRAWAVKRPLAKIREIFALLQLESRSVRWSFHQVALRELFTASLTALPPGKWVEARALFAAAVASYLLSLKQRGVDAEFRRRANEDFHHEKLMAPLEKLHHDLSYWVLHRLALLGLVDLGYRKKSLEALRLSPLGAQFFSLQAAASSPLGSPEGRMASPSAEGAAKMIVNPDFEVLLFPGDERQAELTLTLSHFADCVASERVKRYQVNAESVKRGVIGGMEVGAILGFLDANSSGPLPPNVRYSIREWGEGVEPIQRQWVLLLRARSKAGAERLQALLEAHEVPCERFGDSGLLVQAARGERVLRELREALRDQGLYLE